MGIRLYQEPKLEKPDMIASWPGIGNMGVLAVDTLRGQIRAEELGEIEPWDFFYPRKVVIKASILEDLEFPRNKFYYRTYQNTWSNDRKHFHIDTGPIHFRQSCLSESKKPTHYSISSRY